MELKRAGAKSERSGDPAVFAGRRSRDCGNTLYRTYFLRYN